MSNSDSVTPVHLPSRWSAPWSAQQQATLNALLDLMIPASNDGQMPAASALGLFDTRAGLSGNDLAQLAAGLDQIDSQANERYRMPFGQLDAKRASELAGELRTSHEPFYSLLTTHAVCGYYEHAQVLQALGVQTDPPWPGGHSVEQGDWSLLDEVRLRKAIYRTA